MPINAHPDYLAAEKEHLSAQNLEDKIKTLEKMISLAPKHKGAENLRAQLKTRLKKLLEKKEKEKKSKKGAKQRIKKHEMQAVIVGFTNTGKSSIISLLTNAQPKISEHKFTTTAPVIGMMNYAGSQIQLIENPAIESEYFNSGIANTADTLIILVDKLEEIEKIENELKNVAGKKIIVFNKIDLLSEQEKRKIFATLQSRKYNFVLISAKTQKELDERAISREKQFNQVTSEIVSLKNKIFQSFNKIRIYTKEPGKQKTEKPIILKTDSTVKDVAEKILHGFSDKVKETKIWGPSSKFPGQKVGLQHKLKDLDVVEFRTR